MTNVYINSNKYFLTSGKIREFELSKSGFEHFISMGELPVIKSSNIYWRYEGLYD
jgi:hypothetical protein